MESKIKWELIDSANLPQGEVLAANFKPQSYGYKEKLLGHLYMDNEKVCCESQCEVLENCTHFIDINNHDVV